MHDPLNFVLYSLLTTLSYCPFSICGSKNIHLDLYAYKWTLCWAIINTIQDWNRHLSRCSFGLFDCLPLSKEVMQKGDLVSLKQFPKSFNSPSQVRTRPRPRYFFFFFVTLNNILYFEALLTWMSDNQWRMVNIMPVTDEDWR